MESTPQSTITHNVVIEFASDLWCSPTPRRGRGPASKKGGLPCPKGRPQIGGDHAKKVSPAQRRGGPKPVISAGICWPQPVLFRLFLEQDRDGWVAFAQRWTPVFPESPCANLKMAPGATL